MPNADLHDDGQCATGIRPADVSRSNFALTQRLCRDIAARLVHGVLAMALVLPSTSPAFAQSPLPQGGTVVSGAATMTATSSSAMTIDQTSSRGIINWNSFSIGQGASVTFQQPGRDAATLNRVTGSTSSSLAGRLSGNGQVFLVNPNGIAITPTGTVQLGGGFVASTLDITNDDFNAGRLTFNGGSGSAGVVNAGRIAVGSGGFAALLGASVDNDGDVSVPVGRIGLGAGGQATLDLSGDGFLQIAVPTSGLRNGRALVGNAGTLQAAGGRVELKAATVRGAIRDAVNVPGRISARSASGRDGAIVLGGGGGGRVAISGSVTAGRSVEIAGHDVSISGTIDVRGGDGVTAPAGVMLIAAGNDIRIDPTGLLLADGTEGGTIGLAAGGVAGIAGRIAADGTVAGGSIDITGRDVVVSGATVSATGGSHGGLVRIGGAFRGGKDTDLATPDGIAFVGRFGAPHALASAETTRIDAASTIDVSATGVDGLAGTVIVWSEIRTDVAGAVRALDRVGAGTVELSSRGVLGALNLPGVALARGGRLLLDPKDIVVGGSVSDPAGSIAYDGDAGTSVISAVGLSDLIVRHGISVSLEASNDIVISDTLGFSTGGFAANYGDLTLRAGRSIFAYGDLLLQSAGGLSSNVTLLANDPAAVGPRDPGEAEITLLGRIDLGGTGHLSAAMERGATPASGGTITLSGVQAGSVAAVQNGTADRAAIQFYGNVTTSGNQTYSGGLVVAPFAFTSHLDLASTGGTIAWTTESTSSITAGFELPSTVAFWQAGQLTRYGKLAVAFAPDPDATRLAVGPGAGSLSRVYGDGTAAITPAPDGLVHVTRGALRSGDTLASLTAPGALVFSGPEVTAPVGTANGSVAPLNSATFGFTTANAGYFIDLTTPVPVTITPRALTYSVASPTYEYGSPLALVGLSGLVNGDTVQPQVDIPALGSALTLVATADTNQFALSERAPAGAHAYTVSGLFGTAAGNYSLVPAGATGGTATIDPRTLSYVCCNATSTYGDTPPTPSVAFGNVLSGDTVAPAGIQISNASGVVALDARTDAGTYRMSATGLTGFSAGNYRLPLVGAANPSLTIDSRTLGFSASSPLPRIYGDAAPTFALNGVLIGDTVGTDWRDTTSGASYAPGLDVGTYTYGLNLNGPDASNYRLGGSTQTFTLQQRSISADFTGLSFVYGFGGLLTPALRDLLPGDDVAPIVAGTFGTSTSHVGALPFDTNVGTYGAEVIALSGADGANYRVTAGSGIVTVTPRPVTYSFDGGTYLYGDPRLDTAEAGQPRLTGVIAKDEPFIQPVLGFTDSAGTSSAPSTRTPVGTYATTVSGLASSGAALPSNYVLDGANSTSGAARIDPRPISVVMADVMATYGDGPTVGNTTRPLSGLVNGEIASISVGLFTLADTPVTTVATPAGTAVVPQNTDAGTYTIRGTGFTNGANGFDARNYALTTFDGTLTLAPRPLTYTLADITTTYGDPLPSLATLTGVIAGDDVSPLVTNLLGNRFTDRTPVNSLGWGMVMAGIEGSRAHNYAITVPNAPEAVLTIDPRPIVIDPGSQTAIFGTAPVPFSPTLTGVLPGDEVTAGAFAVVSRVTGNPASLDGLDTVGAYTVTATSLAGTAARNYRVNPQSPMGQLTIEPLPVTVVLPSDSREWGFDTELPLFGVFPVAGVGVPFDLTTTALKSSPAGTYDIRGRPGGANAVNFAFTIVPGTLTVTPLQIVATTMNTTTVYGETPAPSVQMRSATTFRPVDFIDTRLGTFTASGRPIDSRLEGGQYSLGYTLPATGNYQHTGTSPGILAVTPRTIHAQTSPLQVTYGESPRSISVDSSSGVNVLPGDVVNLALSRIAEPQGSGPALDLSSIFNSDGTIRAATFNFDGTPESYREPPYAGQYRTTSGAVVGSQSRNYVLGDDVPLQINPRTITVTGGTATTTYGNDLAVYPPRYLVDPGNVHAPGTYTFGNLALDSHAQVLVPNISTAIRPADGGPAFSYENLPNVDAGTYTAAVIPGQPGHLTTQTINGVSQPYFAATCSNVGSYCFANNYVIANTGNADVTIAVQPRPVTFDVANRHITYGTPTTLSASLDNVLERDRDALGVAFGISEGGTLKALSGGARAADGTYSGPLERAPAGQFEVSIAGLTGTAARNYQAVSAGSVPGTLLVDRKLVTYTTFDAYGFQGYGTGLGNMRGFGTFSLEGLIDGDIVTPELALADQGFRMPVDARGNPLRDANGFLILTNERGWFSNLRPLKALNLNDPAALAEGDYGIVMQGLGGPHGANYQISATGNRIGVLSWLKLEGFVGTRFGEPDIVHTPLPTPPKDSPTSVSLELPDTVGSGTGTGTGPFGIEAGTGASAGASASASLGNVDISIAADARAEAIASLNLWSTTPIDLSASVSATIEVELVVKGLCGDTPCELAIGAGASADASLSAKLDLLTGASISAEAGLSAGAEARFQSACGEATCVVSGGVTASVGASASGEASWDDGLETDTEVGVSIGVDVTGEVGVGGGAGSVTAAGGISTGRLGVGESIGGSFSDGTLHLDLGLSLHVGIVGVTFDLGIDIDVYEFADAAKDTANAVGDFYRDGFNAVGCAIGLGGCSKPEWERWVDFESPADRRRAMAVVELKRDLAAYKADQQALMSGIMGGYRAIEDVKSERYRLTQQHRSIAERFDKLGLKLEMNESGTMIIDPNPPQLAKFKFNGEKLFIDRGNGWEARQ